MESKSQPAGDLLIVRAMEPDADADDSVNLEVGPGEIALQKGQVVAVVERTDPEGKRIPLDVSEGDEILYSKSGGTEIEVNGEDLLVLRGSDILNKPVVALGRERRRKASVAEATGDSSDHLARLKGEIRANIEELHDLAK